MFLKKKYDKAGPLVAEAMIKRGFDAYYVSTKEEAKAKVMEMIPEGASVAWGGSMTLNETGIKDAVKAGNYTVIDRETAQPFTDEWMAIMRQALIRCFPHEFQCNQRRRSACEHRWPWKQSGSTLLRT